MLSMEVFLRWKRQRLEFREAETARICRAVYQKRESCIEKELKKKFLWVSLSLSIEY